MSFQCKICDMKFKQDSILTSHINIHLGRKCKICNQTFKLNAIIDTNNSNNSKCRESHVWLSKQSEKIKTANISSSNSINPSYATTVSPRNNYNPSSNQWKCQYCEYATCSRHRLTKHHRTHTNERPYKCDECGKRFTVQCNLNQHILSIHTTEKPYKCHDCSLGFIRRDKLREHERIHTGERPYECSHCHQKFARKSSLNKHIKIHIGFKCRYCSNIFESESQLKSHKKLMHKGVLPETGTKWFQFGCNLCQKRFFTEDLLQEHIKLHKGFPCNKCHNVYDTDIALKKHECKPLNNNGNDKISTAKPLKVLQDRIERETNNADRINKKLKRNGYEGDNIEHYCVECDRYFKSGQSLGGHRSRVHSRKRIADKQNIDPLVKKAVKKKKKQYRKKNNNNNAVKKKQNEMDMIEIADDNEGENELDLLVRRRLLRKQENKVGVNIFGEYATNNDKTEEIKKKKERSKIKKRAKKKKDKNVEIKNVNKNIFEKEDDGKPKKDCPARHGLKLQSTPDDRVFECDECNKTMYLNEDMYGCRWCNYDLCVKCYTGKEPDDDDDDNNHKNEPWIFTLCIEEPYDTYSVKAGDISPMIQVIADKTGLKCKYRNNEMIWYQSKDKEKSAFCRYILENDINDLNAEFSEFVELRYLCSDKKRGKTELEAFKNELNEKCVSFINPNIFDNEYIIGLKILATEYEFGGGIIIKAITIKIPIPHSLNNNNNNNNKENEECKTMRFNYGEHEINKENEEEMTMPAFIKKTKKSKNKKKNKVIDKSKPNKPNKPNKSNKKKPKIVLSLNRKRKRNINDNDKDKDKKKVNENNNINNINNESAKPRKKRRKLTIKIPRLKKTNEYFTVEFK